jgi:hypothetical protein
MSECGNYFYHISIIDYLQPFKLRKKTEAFCKGLFSDASQISVMNPKNYSKRFYRFMKETVFISPKNRAQSVKNQRLYIDEQAMALIEAAVRTRSIQNKNKSMNQSYLMAEDEFGAGTTQDIEPEEYLSMIMHNKAKTTYSRRSGQ